MQTISGLKNIISRYDALLLDLWGVVHDGSQRYPGVHETLTNLRQAGKKIIMISNAPRRVHKVVAVLAKLGIEPELYDRVITSGELGYAALASGEWPVASGEKANFTRHSSLVTRHYYYIGPSKDADVLDGLDYKRVNDLKDADFLLNVGFGSEEESAENWRPLLRAAKALELPMLCLNPDMEVVKITGERFACAGVLAADYERLGGEVKYFGKPFAEVYEYCLELLNCPLPNPPPQAGEGISKDRILAIGDGIATDIAGAVNFGIDAALVTGGIIKKSDNVEALCRKYNAMPKYVMPRLAW